jgi:hypothetical protein
VLLGEAQLSDGKTRKGWQASVKMSLTHSENITVKINIRKYIGRMHKFACMNMYNLKSM